MKRVRPLGPAKDGQIKVGWGREPHETPDICYAWGNGVPKGDANMVMHALSSERLRPTLTGNPQWEKSILDELEERGYDLTTLKFSIQKKEQS